MLKLPIQKIIPKLKNTFRSKNRIILEAPAGAGKSTIVPISLLDEEYLENKIIIMLEPRRIAAKTLAIQMSKLLNEEVGQSIGYQVKMDSCFSKKSKIIVVTEGILTRKLQNDQALEDVALIIFDEFHDRSISSDLSLALALQVQEMLREDLKILIMSATINTQKISQIVENSELIKSEGRLFDIEEIYLDENTKHPSLENIDDLLLKTILNVFKNDCGDILVFLPGVKQINYLQEKLNTKLSQEEVQIHILYSNLSLQKQNEAILKKKKRKIILSTNIAQTSLTIEGIQVVIDSGLEKQISFNSSNDMNHLEYEFISKESAIQRAGRAGRLSKGKCYKLWHKSRILVQTSKPEILRADLSSFILEATLWGVKDLKELKLLDIPSEKSISAAKISLNNINMLDKKSDITKEGKLALSLGVHPRFARMILKANELELSYDACILASLLIEKDILTNTFSSSSIYQRYEILKEEKFNFSYINISNAKQVLKQAKYIYSKLGKIVNIRKNLNNNKVLDEKIIGVLLLFAYPNKLAKLREKNDNKYKLSNQKGAFLNFKDGLFNTEFLVVPNLNAKEINSQIIYACPILLEDIKKYFSSHLKHVDKVIYKKDKNTLELKTFTYFFKLELFSKANTQMKKDKYPFLLIELIKQEGLELLFWSKKANDLISKVCFLNNQKNEMENSIDIKLPDFTKHGLEDNIHNLEPFLQNITSLKALKDLDTYLYLQSMLSWKDLQTLEKILPSTLKVPSGSNIKIDYSDNKTAILKVKIQEVFGLKQTPKILNNSIAVQMHLLSPANRPIQITYDLESFWNNSYEEVRKELRGKYKKHYWPLNPQEAIATNQVKKKGATLK